MAAGQRPFTPGQRVFVVWPLVAPNRAKKIIAADTEVERLYLENCLKASETRLERLEKTVEVYTQMASDERDHARLIKAQIRGLR